MTNQSVILPPELAQAVAELDSMNDKALWKAARSRLPLRDSAKIEKLHLKRQSVGLDENEQKTLAALMRKYEKSILIRAKSTALLHRRGYDVAVLVKN